MKDPIQQDEDRPKWLREHSAWIRLNRRRVYDVNNPQAPQWMGDSLRSDDPVPFVNLTLIRHRLEPPEKLSAMEEARRLDSAERRHEWVLAATRTVLIVLLLVVWTKLALMLTQ